MLLVAGITLLGGQAVQAQNLIDNPGAEEDEKNTFEDPSPREWTEDPERLLNGYPNDWGSGEFGVFVAPEGESVLLPVEPDPAGVFNLQQDVTGPSVTGGVEYDFSGKYKTKSYSSDDARVLLEFRDGNGTVLDTYDTGRKNTSGAWSDFRTRVTSPSGTQLIRVLLKGYEVDRSRFTDVAFDDLELFPVNAVPQIATNRPLPLAQGGTATITQALLETTDAESGPSGLTYTIESNVSSGDLLKNGSPMGSGDTFTQADVTGGAIEYRHDGSDSRSDAFDFSVADASGTTLTGTFDVVTSPLAYGAGTALMVNGTDDYVKGPSMNLSGSAITLEGWVKPDQFPNTLHTIAGIEAPGGTALLRVGDGGIPPDKPQFVLEFSGTAVKVNASTTLSTNEWQHVAGVYDGSEMRIYVDGRRVGTKSQSGSFSANGRFQIGRSNESRYFDGRMDQIRVWRTALSLEQIRARMHRTVDPGASGLFASYRLDAGSGLTAYDVAGGLDGTLQNTAGFTRFSGAPIGQHSAALQSGSQTLGPSGGTVAVSDVTNSGASALAVYQYGRTDGPYFGSGRPAEDFSQVGDDVDKRLHVVWGLEPLGAAQGSLTADLTFEYTQVQGLANASNVRLLKRTGPGAPWQDVSGDWTWDEQNQTFSRTGASTFSQYAIGEASTALPVELAGFEGTTTDKGVQLTWRTASEQNNAGFRVERRAQERGGESAWTTVGFVEGGGTTSEARRYRFTDEDLPYAADSVSYRLKQVDTDGTTSLSEAVTVARGGPEQLELLGTAPNPARNRAIFRYAIPEGTGGDVTIRLYDVLGRQVRTVSAEAEPGRHKGRLDVSGLPSGVYVLRLVAGGEAQSRKLTVVQ